MSCCQVTLIEMLHICRLLLFVEMARSLFDLFYDEDCVNERAFLEWFQNVNQEESNDHNEICKSTKEFFDWLMLVKADTSEEDDDEHDFDTDDQNEA